MAEQITDTEIAEITKIIDNLPFDQMAESYVQFQKYQQDPGKWDEETRRQFLKVYKGPGTGQSHIFNNTIDNIHSNITGVIQEFKNLTPEEKDSYEVFSNTFEELIKKHQPSHTPRQVIRAMAIMLFPTTYCQIADPIKLKEVWKHLKLNPQGSSADRDWDSMNREVQKHLCENIVTPNADPKSPINIALGELKIQLNNQNIAPTNCDDEELRKFIISFIPWEIYEQKIKVESLKKRLEICGNLIFTGAPGTGKTYLAKQIAAKMIGCEPNELEKSEHFAFVQFHPSYDYTDLVEGLRPQKSIGNKGVDFELMDGVFKQFCLKALDDKVKKPYVFIIDEINRGEMSKIFGELFFSIDPHYRGEQGVVQTQYANMVKWGNQFDRILGNGKKGQFFVPENVYIIGTMNDIDRSVESMDFAFRRRFTFIEVTAEDSMGMLGQLGKKANDARKVMKALNEALISPEKGGLTSAYQIGGSYFLKLKHKKDKDEFISFEELWDYHLKGTLY
jgi:DNA replication protein DnaC